MVRSLRLVQESEVVGTETAKLVHSQTEQLKDIHADAQTLQAEISRANSLLVRMGRRAWTDRLTRALLILISIGICACVAARLVLGPAPLTPIYPPPTPSPPPPPPPPEA